MPEGLKLIIDADLSKAEKALDSFVKTAEKDGTRAAQALERPLTGVAPAVNKAVTSLNKVPQASNKAKFSMIELSRVVQDLPFGFIGIANNLTQLIPGIGFLGLAFSGLVSALTFAQVGTSAWTRGMSGAKKESDGLTSSVEKTRQEQEKFNSAMNDAAAAVVNEAGKIEDLRRVLVDTSNDYNTLTESIIKQGLAQALFSDKESVVQKQLARAIGDRLNVEKTLAEFRASSFEDTKKDERAQGAIIEAQKQGLQVLGVVEDANTKKLRDKFALYKQEEKQISIINDIARTLGVTFDQFVKKDKIKKEVEFEPKFLTKDLSRFLQKPLNLGIIQADVQGIKFQTIPPTDLQKLKEQLEKGIKGLTPSIALEIKTNQANLDKSKAEFTTFVTGINNTIQQVQVDSLANVGEAIGAALTGGDLGSVFADFGNIIASGLQSIGKQFIVIGGLAKLTEKALVNLFTNPGLAIAAGVGLIAAGAALKASLSKGISGFAQGGLVFGPTLGMVGEGSGTRPSNPEVIAPLDKLRSMIGELGGGRMRVEVVGRFRGNEFIVGNSRTDKQNRRMGAR